MVNSLLRTHFHGNVEDGTDDEYEDELEEGNAIALSSHRITFHGDDMRFRIVAPECRLLSTHSQARESSTMGFFASSHFSRI